MPHAAALGRGGVRARAELAAQNVGDGVIRAPFAGVVAERFIEVGQFVRQDSEVATPRLRRSDPAASWRCPRRRSPHVQRGRAR